MHRSWSVAFFTLTLALVLVASAARWQLARDRWICVDEFEHLHAAWCLTPAGGAQLPYRDFFEHHPPLLYYTLAPLLCVLGPEESFDRGWAAVLWSRRLMWVLGCVLLWLTYRLGARQHSRAAGALAVLCALSSMMFVDRSIEIRPDMLSVPCILGALLLTLRAARRARHTALWLALSGILFGLAFLATPKTLFALLGYTPAAAAWMLERAWRQRRPARALAWAAAHCGGFALPLALVALWFAAQGALWHLVHYTFLLNLHWKFRLDPWNALGEVAYENPLLAGLGLAGLLLAFSAACRRSVRLRGRLIVPATLAGLLAGVFLIPVPYTEYFMMPIPLLAILQAGLLVGAVKQSRGRTGATVGRRQAQWSLAYGRGAVLLGALGVAGMLAYYRPPFFARPIDLLWIAALPLTALAVWRRQRYLALAILLAPMLLFPVRRFSTLFDLDNQDTQRAMACIYRHARPHERVLDGWKMICAPFRPHAWFYFFLHREVRPMLTGPEAADLHAVLRDPARQPAVVVFDEDNRTLITPEMLHPYRNTEVDGIFIRTSEAAPAR